MTPLRLVELFEEHLAQTDTIAAHLVLSDRIYEESGDEELAAFARWNAYHMPKGTYIWIRDQYVADSEKFIKSARMLGKAHLYQESLR